MYKDLIQARYRDIPIEEVRKCIPDYPAEEWAALRGKPVTILTPAVRHPGMNASCPLPKYARADGFRWVCRCFAEIDD